MTVRELISILLHEEMGKEVVIEMNHGDEYEITGVSAITDIYYGGVKRIVIRIEGE